MKPAFAALPLALLAACDAGTEPDVSPAPEGTANAATPSLPTVAEMAAPPAPGGIGCSPKEAPIFACNLGNGKRIAVCSGGEYSAQYRYGSSTPELVIDGGEFGYQMYSGGGEGQIAFNNEGFRYVVFSRMVRTNFTAGEPNYPALTDGVIVLRGEDFVAMHLCDDPAVLPIQLFTADAVWERQEELSTGETIRADP
jgi:hypothetical protein